MPEQDGDKTQDPTPHRREEARGQGEVARSHDLASGVVLLSAVALLYAGWNATVDLFGGLAVEHLGGRAWLTIDNATAASQFRGLLVRVATPLAPLLGLTLLAAVGANLLQFGFLFLPEKLSPDIARLNPITAFGRIFSLTNLVKLTFGLLKILLVASIAWYDLSGKIDELAGLAALEVPQAATYLTTTLFWITLKIAAVLVLLAVLDYGYQWWKHEQDLKMTTQEVREEMKNLQGDPQIIARRRQVQRQLVANRLKTTVPKADVVVTNPTELAIALQYDPDVMRAPVVLAKGAGMLAAEIRKIALENGIPIIEKKPLAQALYKDVDVGKPIPGPLYSAVAEIMAYVYQLKGKTLPPRGAA